MQKMENKKISDEIGLTRSRVENVRSSISNLDSRMDNLESNLQSNTQLPFPIIQVNTGKKTQKSCCLNSKHYLNVLPQGRNSNSSEILENLSTRLDTTERDVKELWKSSEIISFQQQILNDKVQELKKLPQVEKNGQFNEKNSKNLKFNVFADFCVHSAKIGQFGFPKTKVTVSKSNYICGYY